jgi:hypothetical protein
MSFASGISGEAKMDVPKDTQFGIWLRCPTSAGRKDWRGFVTTTGVVSQWGKINFINQEKVLFDRPSHGDLSKKINEKAAKGYKVIAHYDVASKTWVMVGQSPPAPKSVVPPAVPPKMKPAPKPSPPQSQPDTVLREWVATARQEETWF